MSLLGADTELEVLFGDTVPILGEKLLVPRQHDMNGQTHTLYTIMTASKLRTVAKNRPSR